MAAQAVQSAPVQKTEQTGKQQSGQKKTETPKGLAALPRTAGIGIMAVMLVASLFVGNMRALQSVTPAAFLDNEVRTIVEERVTDANNAVTVARRAALDESVYTAVTEAGKTLSAAKTAREISRASEALQTAVTNMTSQATGLLSTQDQKLLTGAIDEFTQEGSFLRQEARTYNAKAEKAVALYNSLPTRFVLSEPDYYEGL